jgi:hypothetical protein
VDGDCDMDEEMGTGRGGAGEALRVADQDADG